MLDPTQRFSSRVENYVKYRPSYPPAIIDLLATECGLTPASIIADVGSGTGLLTELFLKNGNQVCGIEPNREMRATGEQLLKDYAHFISIAAAAEATTLTAHSVDFVTAGQSFHWFDRDQARQEFKRIVKPQGWVVLIWNERRTTSTPFQQDYERLLHTYATDYAAVDHKQIDADHLRSFFGSDAFRLKTFDNQRMVDDFEGLKGGLLSASYTPEAGHPNHLPMLEELRRIFEAHQIDGRVRFEYDTQIYYGRL
jgi:ubiquinone/menaquinone biosynthesis C-methylase UbiE